MPWGKFADWCPVWLREKAANVPVRALFTLPPLIVKLLVSVQSTSPQEKHNAVSGL